MKSSSLKELTAASQAARSVNVVKFAASAMPADKVLKTAAVAKLFTVYDRKKFSRFFLFTWLLIVIIISYLNINLVFSGLSFFN
ncbi:MAG: hypothetical protein WBA93_03625 [Microcoleaceae cyanobacterium]